MSDTFNHEADAWDSLNDEEDDRIFYSKPIKCKYCGALNVSWVQTENKWRLFENKKPHTCKQYAARKL